MRTLTMQTPRGSWVPVVLLALLAAVGCGKKKSDSVDAAASASSGPSASAADPASMDPAAAAANGFKLYDAEPPDDKGAIPFFDRACKGGDQKGCMGIGLASLDGRGGVARDYAKAFELLEAACKQKLMRGCSAVGGMKYFAKGMEADQAGGRALWQQACDGGEPRGCHMLGVMYAASDAPAEWHDLKAALAMHRKACEGGYKDSCREAKVVELHVACESGPHHYEATCTDEVKGGPDYPEKGKPQLQPRRTKADCEEAVHDMGLAGMRCTPCSCVPGPTPAPW